LIDRIPHDIQQRLDQLLAEADRLRHALAALDPRECSAPKPKTTDLQSTEKRAAKTPDAKQAPARARTRVATTADGASGPARTPPGETKAQVVAALSKGQALTAGEVAQASGLARPTVSTTPSKLLKTGDVIKADVANASQGKKAEPETLPNRRRRRRAQTRSDQHSTRTSRGATRRAIGVGHSRQLERRHEVVDSRGTRGFGSASS